MPQKADVEIRTCIMPVDIPDIMEIERACFSDPWPQSGVESELYNPYGLYVLAFIEGRCVGYIMGTALYEDCDINNVAVSPAYRRIGIGRRMMESFLNQCRQKGVERVMLEVRESNAQAIGLYRAFGFEELGRRCGYYEKPAEDAVLMVVELC